MARWIRVWDRSSGLWVDSLIRAVLVGHVAVRISRRAASCGGRVHDPNATDSRVEAGPALATCGQRLSFLHLLYSQPQLGHTTPFHMCSLRERGSYPHGHGDSHLGHLTVAEFGFWSSKESRSTLSRLRRCCGDERPQKSPKPRSQPTRTQLEACPPQLASKTSYNILFDFCSPKEPRKMTLPISILQKHRVSAESCLSNNCPRPVVLRISRLRILNHL